MLCVLCVCVCVRVCVCACVCSLCVCVCVCVGASKKNSGLKSGCGAEFVVGSGDIRSWCTSVVEDDDKGKNCVVVKRKEWWFQAWGVWPCKGG